MECKNVKEIENVCKTCGKKYSTTKILKNHVKKIHLGILPFECKQCGKRFQFPSLLKYHGPTHTGTKSNGSIIHRKEFVNSISDTEKQLETEGKFFLKI